MEKMLTPFISNGMKWGRQAWIMQTALDKLTKKEKVLNVIMLPIQICCYSIHFPVHL